MVRFFYVKNTKMLSFFLVAEALTGLIYHRPPGENSSFHFTEIHLFEIYLGCTVLQEHRQDKCEEFSKFPFKVMIPSFKMLLSNFSIQEQGNCRTYNLNQSHYRIISMKPIVVRYAIPRTQLTFIQETNVAAKYGVKIMFEFLHSR